MGAERESVFSQLQNQIGSRARRKSGEGSLRERVECGTETGKGKVRLAPLKQIGPMVCVTLGGVQVHLHRGVPPGVQDFPGKDFLHGHGCRTGGGSECGHLIPEGIRNLLPFKSLPHPKKAGAGAKNTPWKGQRPKRQTQPPPSLRAAIPHPTLEFGATAFHALGPALLHPHLPQSSTMPSSSILLGSVSLLQGLLAFISPLVLIFLFPKSARAAGSSPSLNSNLRCASLPGSKLPPLYPGVPPGFATLPALGQHF